MRSEQSRGCTELRLAFSQCAHCQFACSFQQAHTCELGIANTVRRGHSHGNEVCVNDVLWTSFVLEAKDLVVARTIDMAAVSVATLSWREAVSAATSAAVATARGVAAPIC